MKKKLLLAVLALSSLLVIALPALASSNTIPSDNSTPSVGVAVAQDSKLQVDVQVTPEKSVAGQPVDYMVIIKDKATGQPVTDASVRVNMTLMDNSMAGMSMPTDTIVEGQAKMDMEPGMYMLSLTPTQQGDWTQTFYISSPTLGETTVTAPLKVAESISNWVLIGGIAGLVVLAGIYAQRLKHKKTSREG